MSEGLEIVRYDFQSELKAMTHAEMEKCLIVFGQDMQADGDPS